MKKLNDLPLSIKKKKYHFPDLKNYLTYYTSLHIILLLKTPRCPGIVPAFTESAKISKNIIMILHSFTKSF